MGLDEPLYLVIGLLILGRTVNASPVMIGFNSSAMALSKHSTHLTYIFHLGLLLIIFFISVYLALSNQLFLLSSFY